MSKSLVNDTYMELTLYCHPQCTTSKPTDNT